MILEAHKEKAFLIKELELLSKESSVEIKSPPYIENNKKDKSIPNQNNNKINQNPNNSINQDIVSQDSEFMSYNTNKDKEEEELNYNNGNYNGLNNISYTPLKQLTSLTKDYKLLIKIVNKGEIKEFRNGKGKLFSCVMMDEFGSKMQVVAFDKMVDKYKDENPRK